MNEWALQALKERGIFTKKDGSLEVEFYKGKLQKVSDLNTAIRQQKHIIDQQKTEQKENEEIGKLMSDFNNTTARLKSMSAKDFTAKRKERTMTKLAKILTIMSNKREDLRKDGHYRLANAYRMLDDGNIPAAVWASNAAIDRMRKRWLVNEKVIDKSLARLSALENLKK